MSTLVTNWTQHTKAITKLGFIPINNSQQSVINYGIVHHTISITTKTNPAAFKVDL